MALLSDSSAARVVPSFALTVSVKSLCAFAAKAGDLDLRFAPAPSAQEGIAGHHLVQSRRGPGFQGEVSLSSSFGGLRVRGRADGFDLDLARVEEIKTFRGEFDAIKGNHRALHWAQARTYAAMLCEKHALAHITVALVYLDIHSGDETVLEEHRTRGDLQAEFEALCGRFMAWAQQESLHRAELTRDLSSLAFPHAGFRPGQRELAEGVFRAAAAGRCLIAQAPTGIGKTIATLFPLLKSWAAHRTDKLFFLTAKTSGRAVALDALHVLRKDCTTLRVLELAAREKVCEYPGRACNGDACPLAAGFYDRLPAARSEAIGQPLLNRETVRTVASTHRVCPYFLAQELVRWSDVVVADYNYYFDGSAFLYALMIDEEWRAAVLVDEAHNLVERARSMYSSELDSVALAVAMRVAPRQIKQALGKLEREWDSLQLAQRGHQPDDQPGDDAAEPSTAAPTFTPSASKPYSIRDQIPERLHRALQEVIGLMSDHFADHPAEANGPMQPFFFDMLRFVRLSDEFGEHSVLESTVDADPDGACGFAIRNLIPAHFLKPRFERALSVTCFSGTIAPFAFYRDALGMPHGTVQLDVGSPFQTHQLTVRVAMQVSTRYRDRGKSLARLTNIIAAQYQQRPGNYLAFFSSFDYLDSACNALATRHPDVPMWAQSRGMREAEREAFVARFVAGGQGIGFAVLGGAFGEGIDLPGERLVGAFIASLGLPQHSALNDVMRERMQARFGQGYEYTYLYPGLRKVVQAAGRVIRTEQDAGVLYLLDDRFALPEVRRLLPPWWHIEEA
ncbi:ATP-dependent DNA helicase [soil metagenome]